MTLQSIKFTAGINSDITNLSNQGGFIDGNKIRFHKGYAEKIGGWAKYSSSTYQGVARALHNWVALDGSDYLGLGTHLKYYIEEGTVFNDITPVRVTTSAGDVTFSATNGSTTITVTDASHGANENDFVTFSDAATLGGVVTATVLNAEHQITSIVSSNVYTITVSAAANSSDTGSGGGSTVGVYQINVGLDVSVGGTGWGAGQWGGTTSGALATQLNEALDNSETAIDVDDETGMNTANDVILIDNELMLVSATTDDNTMTVTRAYAGSGASSNVNTASHGSSNASTDAVTHDDNTLVRLAKGNATSTDDFTGWGVASAITTDGAQIRTWTHDNFGEDLIINPRDGGIYYWDKTNGLSTAAVLLNTRAGTKTSIPTVAKQVMVTDISRHVIAFGCDGIGALGATDGDGVQDPLLIRFSAKENPLEWFPSDTSTAGDLRLGGGSEFMQAVETKQQILILTNRSLHSMTFTGHPYTFGLQELSKNITIMSSKSAVAVDDTVYWMGIDSFYVYSGQTQQLPCTVKNKVFLDINLEQKDKVHAGVNSEYGEVIWFYPTASSTDIDAYVIYNYIENVWYYGTLARDAWLDRGIRTLPQATGSSYLYNHESGNDDDGSAMTSFIESAPMDIGDGHKFVSINRIIPDVSFKGSDTTTPTVSLTVKAKDFSGSNYDQTGSGTIERSATSPIEQFTNKIDYRIRGRSFVLRYESSQVGSKYKLGTPRVDLREDGRR